MPIPVFNDGTEDRFLAALPPKPVFGIPEFSAQYPDVPRDQWRDVDFTFVKSPILDQLQTNKCVAFSAATTFARAREFFGYSIPPSQSSPGQPWSPHGFYTQICNGVDQGANLSDGVKQLGISGIPLADDVPNKNVLNPAQVPQAAWDTAKRRFMVDKAWIVRDFDQLGSMIMLGFLGAAGLPVGSQFNNLDADGACPAPTSQGDILGLHAIHICGLKKARNGEWMLKFANSWGSKWAIQGEAYLRERNFMAQYWDAYAITNLILDPDEPNPPSVPA